MSSTLATASAALTPSTPPTRGAPAKAPQPSGFFRTQVGGILWTFRKEFLWVFVFSAFANVLMLTPTIYMLQLFDRVMSSGNLSTLLAITLLMLLFSCVMAFAEWVRSRLLVRAGARFDDALNQRVFNAAFQAQLSNTRRNPTQPLNDLNVLRQFLTGNGIFAVADTPWTLVFIVALFLMHPMLGWLALAFCVVQLTLGFIVQRMAASSQKAQQELAMESGQFLSAKLRNAETVEAMGMQGNLRQMWVALNDRHHHEQTRSHELQHRIQALMKWLQYTQQALMLSLGALLVMKGQIGAGAMVASNALMGNALRPVGLIVQIWGQFVEARAAFDRLNTLLQEQRAEPVDAPAAQVVGQVTLRGLKASAPGRNKPILHGLDAEFKAGEVVAIVGASGAGKSSLARCILGIWPQTEGEVLIDGHPVQSWPREVLGPNLGYLPQDVELFDGTIAENISRFTNVGSDVVIEAAKAAGIHDMVLRQPKGYDTPIGDAGSILSGGQRQRLGLARAILGHPAIVVLDEPSANLDDVGEAALVRVVAQLKARGSTVFIIVHQPHLMAVADRALVLDGGRIAQFGNVVRAPLPAAAQSLAANKS